MVEFAEETACPANQSKGEARVMRRVLGSLVLAGIAVTCVVVSVRTAVPKSEGFFFEEKISPPGVFEYAVSFFCWGFIFAIPAALIVKLFFPLEDQASSRTLVSKQGQSVRHPQNEEDRRKAGTTCTRCGLATDAQFFQSTPSDTDRTVLCASCSRLKRRRGA
ncbi:hypothetical protein GCM10009557_03150 [Virgisporangium ochraceum]|uniref:Uncharacterized protein n=2 Tax=Virgisporangium ochraceum TaxID=65505 RepID=A0A8J4EDI2_9ACTN|nr:hypothetical protein Voc01_028940 [Virgisporangium ochraceum]